MSKYRMQWVVSGNRRRWRKQYRKKVYHFEARKGESKAVSYARCWKLWEAKKVAIDAAEVSQHQQMIKVFSGLLAGRASEQATGTYAEIAETIRLLQVAEAKGISLPIDADGQVVPPEEPAPTAPVAATVRAAREKLQRYHDELRDALRAAVRDPAPPWQAAKDSLEVETSILALATRYAEVDPTVNKHRLKVFKDWADPTVDPATLNGDFWRSWHTFVLSKIETGDWSSAYGKTIFNAAKAFVSWLYSEAEVLEKEPRNLRKLTIKTVAKAAKVYTRKRIKQYLEAAEGRTRLYLLLTLNTAMTAIDMADLQPDEVIWKTGRIIRRRSKTRSKTVNVPTVSYQLWPETFRLLREFRVDRDDVVLLTERGTPICTRGGQSGGRSDSVRLSFRRLNKKLGTAGAFLSLKKTSASLIDAEFDHHTAQLFLGHSPGTVADRNYIRGSDTRLDKPLAWLAEQYGLAGQTAPE